MNNHLMRDSKLLNLNIDGLEKRSFKQLQKQTVADLIIVLGSNTQADQHLNTVLKSLAELGTIKTSTAFINPDFTATKQQPKPDYTNQCVYLTLKESVTLEQLQVTFKDLEKECGRLQSLKNQLETKQVAMDIDILMIKLECTKNSLSIYSNDKWIIITNRYPFKDHEVVGIMKLGLRFL